MITRFVAVLAIVTGIWVPALAQSSTGGSIGSFTSTSPGLVCTPSGTASVGISCAQTTPVQDKTGGTGYTVLTGDGGYLTKVGASSGSYTLTVPQAGSSGFTAGWNGSYINTGAIPVSVTTTTSVFEGAGGLSNLSLPVNGSITITSESGNWLTLLSTPTVTHLGPQIVQHVLGSGTGCGAAGGSSSCIANVTAFGTGHSAIIGGVVSCASTPSCSAAPPALTSVTDAASDTCTAISGADSGAGSNVTRAQLFYCPSVTAGTTAFTGTWASASNAYPYISVVEISGGIGTEVGSAAYPGSTALSCATSANTTVADDLIYVLADSSGGTATVGAPWSAVSSNLDWQQIGAALATYTFSGTNTKAQGSCAIVAVKP